MSAELKALVFVSLLEDRIRKLHEYLTGSLMVKTLDQQLSELRMIASEIVRVYGLQVDSSFKLPEVEEFGKDGVELLNDFIKKFLKLDLYIDSLRR